MTVTELPDVDDSLISSPSPLEAGGPPIPTVDDVASFLSPDGLLHVQAAVARFQATWLFEQKKALHAALDSMRADLAAAEARALSTPAAATAPVVKAAARTRSKPKA